MESLEKGKAALIASIETDARNEAETIIQDARTRAAEKRQHGQNKAESILAHAREKAQEQVDAVKRRISAATELEIKRRSLRVRDGVMQDILARVEEKLRTMTGTPAYPTVLANWITEAAIGLDVETAEISASARELPLINAELLKEVTARIQAQTGGAVKLTLANAAPLKSQGVVLTAIDGRMAFNNQVKTRLLRRRRDIQRLIYDALFAQNEEE